MNIKCKRCNQKEITFDPEGPNVCIPCFVPYIKELNIPQWAQEKRHHRICYVNMEKKEKGHFKGFPCVCGLENLKNK